MSAAVGRCVRWHGRGLDRSNSELSDITATASIQEKRRRCGLCALTCLAEHRQCTQRTWLRSAQATLHRPLWWRARARGAAAASLPNMQRRGASLPKMKQECLHLARAATGAHGSRGQAPRNQARAADGEQGRQVGSTAPWHPQSKKLRRHLVPLHNVEWHKARRDRVLRASCGRMLDLVEMLQVRFMSARVAGKRGAFAYHTLAESNATHRKVEWNDAIVAPEVCWRHVGFSRSARGRPIP